MTGLTKVAELNSAMTTAAQNTVPAINLPSNWVLGMIWTSVTDNPKTSVTLCCVCSLRFVLSRVYDGAE